MKSTLPKDTPTLEIIKKLKNEEISWPMLTQEQALGSIVLLLSDGANYVSIAALLKCSEKTVSRYAKKIRQTNAFRFELQDAMETIGEYRTSTEHHLKRLTRIAATAQDDTAKTQATALVIKLWGDYIKNLILLGCLPPTAFRYGEKMVPPITEKTKTDSRTASSGLKIKLDGNIMDLDDLLSHEREEFRRALKPAIERQKEAEKKEGENLENPRP